MPSWCVDERNNLILIKVPKQLTLGPSPASSASDNDDKAAAPPKIAALPLELVHLIIHYLHPVDRVCLALTCKPLLCATLSAPVLNPASWVRFQDQRYDWALPESYSLILRLAHGWTPKEKLRYCWKCHKILPRAEDWWRQRLQMKRVPRWDMKVNMEKEKWMELGKKAKYEHLLRCWSDSKEEDSSYLYCAWCREVRMQESKDTTLPFPVQCPSCLEKELTYVWRPPRQPWVRQKVKKWGRVCEGWLWWPIKHVFYYAAIGFWFVIVGTYTLGKECWELSRTLWQRWRSSRGGAIICGGV